MNPPRLILRRLRALFRKEKLDAEMAEEMRLHLEMQERENFARGMASEAARYTAQRMFGGLEQIKERAREERSWIWLEQLGKDFIYSARSLRKAPGFSAAVIATLALCVGVNTAVFPVVDAFILRPLPFDAPERIVEIYNTYPKLTAGKSSTNAVRFLDYQANARSYAHLGLWAQYTGRFGQNDGALRIAGAMATSGMFDVLGVRPVLGAFFAAKSQIPGSHRVVVLTESFWRSHFEGNPKVLGQAVQIDDETYTIVGVAPRALEAFDARVRFIRAASWPGEALDSGRRLFTGFSLFGRLKAGVSIEQARVEANVLEKRFYDTTNPAMRDFLDRSGFRIGLDGVQAERVRPLKSAVYLLQCAAVLVLLIGVANVANLFLARANGRQAELAIRCALGARRLVVARQLIVESLLLTTGAGLLGLSIAWGALQVINRWSVEVMPATLPFTVDFAALMYTLAISALITGFVGLLPLAGVLRADLIGLMGRASRHASGGGKVRAWSSLLVVVQVAVAVMLLTGAALLVQSFIRVLAIDPGFSADQVVAARVSVPPAHRATVDASRALEQRIMQELASLPGMSGAALATGNPFPGSLGGSPITFAGNDQSEGTAQPLASRVEVSPEYLQTMRLRMVAGRFFEPADLAPGTRAVVVDETFARKFFPGRTAIGERFLPGLATQKSSVTTWSTIIGVVGDVPHGGLEDRSRSPYFYQPLQGRPPELALFVRTSRPAAETLAVLRDRIKAVEPGIVLWDGGPMQAFVDRTIVNRRGLMLLMGGFAGLALLLSAIGVYGVLAYDVSQRTREIGIRSAIGASQAQLLGMILGQGLRKTGIGLTLGLAGAVLLSRYTTTLLFDVKPTDPVAYGFVTVLLGSVAVLASYLPAWRAARIDPLIALRCE